MLRTDYALFHAPACDADLLGPGGGAHDPQPAARLGKRDDLLFEPCLDLRPVIFQRGQLFAQLLLADIFCVRLFQPDFGEIGARIESQRIFFRFGQFGPCGDGPFDIEAGDVAVEELFVIGGRGEQSDADLETVRRGVPVSHFMVFHVPQMAELVVGTAGRSARLVRLHRETAQHEPFDQRPDRFDGTLAHPFRIAERILQSVLDDCESAFVERLHAQCIRNDPVCTRRDFGEQVGITAGCHLFRGCGDYRGIGQYAQRSGTREGLLGPFEGDRRAERRVAVHRGGGAYDHVAAAVAVRAEFYQVVDRSRSHGYGNGIGSLQYGIEFFDEFPLGVQVRRGENMRLVLFHACGRETVPYIAARHPQRRRVGYDDGPFSGKQFPEHIAGLGQDAGPDTQRFGFRGVGQRVFYSVHIVVFCVCLSVRRSVVVPLLLPVRAFCRSVVAVADARDGFSGRIDASGISFPFGKQR